MPEVWNGVFGLEWGLRAILYANRFVIVGNFNDVYENKGYSFLQRWNFNQKTDRPKRRVHENGRMRKKTMKNGENKTKKNQKERKKEISTRQSLMFSVSHKKKLIISIPLNAEIKNKIYYFAKSRINLLK